MRVFLISCFMFISLYLSACLTIGCAEREDRVIDQSDNCCPNCYNCEPKVTIPQDTEPPKVEPKDDSNDDNTDPKPNTPNITIIIDNNNEDNNENSNTSDNNNSSSSVSTSTSTACSKQYNMVSLTEFEMTKKCEKKPPCHGKGKWKKYNGHYVLNYSLNTCDDLMLEQIPCTE